MEGVWDIPKQRERRCLFNLLEELKEVLQGI